MEVNINGREVEYLLDYPTDWKFIAGDPFKFPVTIGDSQCFIKRFEQKSPEDISGWGLMTSIAGKDEKNLSTIYDIKNEQEKGKEIYYVFYEYLEGTTLDKYIQNSNINLTHINNDLFSAIGSLQKYNYWFSDFCEKNIFCQKDGSFILVDVDSTQHISDSPDNEMYGSKDYWILVIKFFKEILGINNIRLTDINGISFNYLQIAFLVLRIKLSLNGDKKDYNSTSLFNQLPTQLNEIAPEFKDVFAEVNANGNQPFSPEQINNIKDIITRRIIKNENIKAVSTAPVSLPVINAFKTSNSEVEGGGKFSLTWQVENAERVELYKNGAKFKDLDISQKDVTLTGFADGTRQQYSFQLIAYKDLAMAKSDIITVKLKRDNGDIAPSAAVIKPDPHKKQKWLVIGGIALLALLIAAFFIFRRQDKSTSLIYVHAGADTSIVLPNNKVLLEGTATDTNNIPIKGSYSWTKIKGQSGEISKPNQSTTWVTQLTQEGTYLFELKATVDNGATASDTVEVIVSPAANIPPIADAGENQSLVLPRISSPGTQINSVTLSGKKSSDPDGNKLTYSWSKVAGPPGGDLTQATKNEPTATVTGLQLGTYQYKLIVTDSKFATGEATVLVWVINSFYSLPGDWKTRKMIMVSPIRILNRRDT